MGGYGFSIKTPIMQVRILPVPQSIVLDLFFIALDFSDWQPVKVVRDR